MEEMEEYGDEIQMQVKQNFWTTYSSLVRKFNKASTYQQTTCVHFFNCIV